MRLPRSCFQVVGVIGLCSSSCGSLRVGRHPACRNLHAGQPLVQELHRQPGHGLAAVEHMKVAGVGEFAEHGRLHVQLARPGPGTRRSSPAARPGSCAPGPRRSGSPTGCRPGYLSGAWARSISAAAALLRHLADGGGEPPGAVVGDEAVEPLVAGDGSGSRTSASG